MKKRRIGGRRAMAVLSWISGLGLVWMTGAVPPVGAQTAISVDGAIESQAGGFVFPDGSVQTTAVAPRLAPVERSGQTNCWDVAGDQISCAGTDQDADLLAGVAWPVPRLTDNGDGTVTDQLTGLIWLEDASCLGLGNWLTGLSNTNGLSAGSCGLTDGSVAGDWRLPNVRELMSLLNFGEFEPALPKGHPFTNLPALPAVAVYWTSTAWAQDTEAAWVVTLTTGATTAYFKAGIPALAGVLPVRGGA